MGTPGAATPEDQRPDTAPEEFAHEGAAGPESEIHDPRSDTGREGGYRDDSASSEGTVGTEPAEDLQADESGEEGRDERIAALADDRPVESRFEEEPTERALPEPPREFRPAAPASVTEAIEEVNKVITSLRQVLDTMEEILETLELAEVQKNADEREIQALRNALRNFDRPSEGRRGDDRRRGRR